MISFATSWAITVRHLRVFQHDMNLKLTVLYWPVLDVLIWGYLGVWLSQFQMSGDYRLQIFLSVLLWLMVGRGCNVIVHALVEELFSRNLVNLFTLPVRITEWIVGVIFLYVIMSLFTFMFCFGMICCLYDVSVYDILWNFLLFAPPLFLSALWLGFTCLQIIVLFGRRGVELAYVVSWFFMPFCAVYYPIEVLPVWGQVLSKFLPMSYVFQAMRNYVMYNQDPTILLLTGYGLGVVYAVVAIFGFIYAFHIIKRYGLARLVE